MGSKVGAGAIGALQGSTEVTSHTLLFMLAGQRHRAALDCHCHTTLCFPFLCLSPETYCLALTLRSPGLRHLPFHGVLAKNALCCHFLSI